MADNTQVSLVDDYVSEYQGIQAQMGDPDVAGDQEQFRKLSKRYAELQPIINVYNDLTQAREDHEAAAEMANEDKEFADEAKRLESEIVRLEEELADLLAPRDEHDGDDVIMELKAGAGGEEAALFAGDLARMYQKYCEKNALTWEVLDVAESDLGGVKDMTVAVKSKNPSRDGAWSKLKFEGGVHRVQRVPVTESQGRIHTSAAGVLVLPEVDAPDEVHLDPNDLKVDVFRSSGPGGQSVNTTDSAVRLTHLPTGIVVSMQNEKSQIQNREAALRVLRSRLLERQRAEQDAENSAARAAQVRTMDRSERIRTYNFPENRIADHRTGYKAHNLDAVLDGDLEAVIASCLALDEERRLAALGGDA